MRVAVVQFHPLFGEVEHNIQRATDMISNVKADLFVLPELCFTGYAFMSGSEVLSLAESPRHGLSINRMKELSSRVGAAIVFGFPEASDDGAYNSCALVLPDGSVSIYRKLHLFLHEKNWFKPGDNLLQTIEFRGCRLGLMICFDWIFPEVARTLSLCGAHLICHPSNLVMPYCQAAMVTRSIENRVYSITANRIGRETRGDCDFRFTGRSQIVSPSGDVLFRGSQDKEEVGVADIDLRNSESKSINEINDIWADRRPEFYAKLTDASKTRQNPRH